MKKNSNIVRGARITNVISACITVLSGLALVFFPEMDSLILSQRVFLSILFALIGAAKLLGYFSNDLYRLAFQFDFAIGIFCWIISLLIILAPARSVPMIPTLLSVYVVLDALLKIQISTDARGFGMTCWIGMIASSVCLFVVSILAVASIYWQWMPETRAVGIALAIDGLENVWITAYTVRVRARKKHLCEHFGLDDAEEKSKNEDTD